MQSFTACMPLLMASFYLLLRYTSCKMLFTNYTNRSVAGLGSIQLEIVGLTALKVTVDS